MTVLDLAKHFGSQAAAARHIGRAVSTVSEWKASGIPYAVQCQIQILTGGKLMARATNGKARA